MAGVMVQGSAVITGNRFEGNGPRQGGPPNFAAWIQGGSTVSFSNNRTDRWRHGLHASGAKSVHATGNTSTRFLGTAIVVRESELPAHVVGNIAVSDNGDDEAVQVTGPQGVVQENARKAVQRKSESDRSRTSTGGEEEQP